MCFQDAGHGLSVNPKPGRQFVDGETTSVRLDKLRGLFATEPSRGILTPDSSGIRTWLRVFDPFAQVSKPRCPPGMVRVSPDKLHQVTCLNSDSTWDSDPGRAFDVHSEIAQTLAAVEGQPHRMLPDWIPLSSADTGLLSCACRRVL